MNHRWRLFHKAIGQDPLSTPSAAPCPLSCSWCRGSQGCSHQFSQGQSWTCSDVVPLSPPLQPDQVLGVSYVWQNHKHFRDAVLWLGSIINSLAWGRTCSKAGTTSWDECGAAERPIAQGEVKRARSSPVTCWSASEDDHGRYWEISCSGWVRSRVGDAGGGSIAPTCLAQGEQLLVTSEALCSVVHMWQLTWLHVKSCLSLHFRGGRFF